MQGVLCLRLVVLCIQRLSLFIMTCSVHNRFIMQSIVIVIVIDIPQSQAQAHDEDPFSRHSMARPWQTRNVC